MDHNQLLKLFCCCFLRGFFGSCFPEGPFWPLLLCGLWSYYWPNINYFSDWVKFCAEHHCWWWKLCLQQYPRSFQLKSQQFYQTVHCKFTPQGWQWAKLLYVSVCESSVFTTPTQFLHNDLTTCQIYLSATSSTSWYWKWTQRITVLTDRRSSTHCRGASARGSFQVSSLKNIHWEMLK